MSIDIIATQIEETQIILHDIFKSYGRKLLAKWALSETNISTLRSYVLYLRQRAYNSFDFDTLEKLSNAGLINRE